MTHTVLPSAPLDYNVRWANQLIRDLQKEIDSLRLSATTARWIVSPAATIDRTINPGTESTDDVRQILATLIEDLRARGILG